MAVKILEKDVEGYLRDQVKAIGVDCHKYINDPRRGGTPGLPDDILVLPDMRMIWAEVKRPDTIQRYLRKRTAYMHTGDVTGCSATEIRQFREQQKLMDRGHTVKVIGTYQDVDDLIEFMELFYL